MTIIPPNDPVAARSFDLVYKIIVLLVVLAVIGFFIPIGGLSTFALPGGLFGLVILLVLLRFVGII